MPGPGRIDIRLQDDEHGSLNPAIICGGIRAAVGILVQCVGLTGAEVLRSREVDIDIGTFRLIRGLSYALGFPWYDLLPGKLPQHVWPMAAYPLLGIFKPELRTAAA